MSQSVTEKLESMLEAYGMFDTQSKPIVELAKPEIQQGMPDGYRITWDSPSDQYPEMMYSLMFITMKPIALKWLKENKPQAWFIPMFDKDAEQ